MRHDYAISAAYPQGKEEQVIRLIDETQLVKPKMAFKPVHSPKKRRKPLYRFYD
jgi:hypothetical protein